MTAPARERRPGAERIHLPSVHVRGDDGSGFDYEEDLFVTGRGRKRRVERVVRLVAFEHGEETLVRETRDVLWEEELAEFEAVLPLLMDRGNPEAEALMEARGRAEFARQLRIARGESVCLVCGCSDTRSCSGGCLWATPTICSRCVR